MADTPAHVARVRRLETLHAQIVARLKFAQACMATAGELTPIGDSGVGTLQRDVLDVGVQALAEAQEISGRHPDLVGWADAMAAVVRDLAAFLDALVVKVEIEDATIVTRTVIRLSRSAYMARLAWIRCGGTALRPLQQRWADLYQYSIQHEGRRQPGLRPQVSPPPADTLWEP